MDDRRKVGNALGALVIAALAAWYYFDGGLEQQTAQDMDEIAEKVAADSLTEYGIANRNGSKKDACVQAGLVAAAFRRAQDETSYRRWKDTQTIDCNAAGEPR